MTDRVHRFSNLPCLHSSRAQGQGAMASAGSGHSSSPGGWRCSSYLFNQYPAQTSSDKFPRGKRAFTSSLCTGHVSRLTRTAGHHFHGSRLTHTAGNHSEAANPVLINAALHEHPTGHSRGPAINVPSFAGLMSMG